MPFLHPTPPTRALPASPARQAPVQVLRSGRAPAQLPLFAPGHRR